MSEENEFKAEVEVAPEAVEKTLEGSDTAPSEVAEVATDAAPEGEAVAEAA